MKKGMGLAAKMAAVAEVWKKDETPTMQFMALLLDLNRHAGRGRTDRADESCKWTLYPSCLRPSADLIKLSRRSHTTRIN